ncbi:hypothetical protein BI198_04845 [Rheinheimera salexigens]|uniref:EAL domain-containing protein n=1 Tax=Rheinheimera salexigens TaxID=1628148 RepID=A0A1E7Q4D4_9GAMM|nr:hypothetical protein BI198_04845 [Rheinheimera salexigens]
MVWLCCSVGNVVAADDTSTFSPTLYSNPILYSPNLLILLALTLALTLLSIVLVISYRKLKQRFSKLKLQHNQLSSFLHHSTQLIAVLDHNMQPLFINSHLLALSQQSTTPTNDLQLALYADQLSLHAMAKLIQQRLIEQPHWQGEVWLGCGAKEKRRSLSVAITRLGDTKPIKYLLIGQDTSNDNQQQQLLLQQHIRDPDTHLLTATIFKEYLTYAMLSCNEQHPKLAVMVIKTNCILGFSEPNYQAGLTKRLILLAEHISALLPKGAILARYNDESLALLIPGHLCSINIDIYLNRLAHNILGVIDPNSVLSIIDQTYIGIAIYPNDGDSAAALLTSAAAALVSASQLSVSRFQFANSLFQQDSVDYFGLESELTNAIAKQQIEVYFQPKLSISNNKVVGYEALIRWHCPKRGLLLPAAFINMADETGLIVKLDHMVFAKCCQQYINWQQHKLNRGRIAINIASLSFQQTDFVVKLEQQLAHFQISAEHFDLELDEDIFLLANTATTETLQQLVALGFHLTLDNFGEGLSSLKVLRQYPLHSVKIARNYIVNMEHNDQQRNITASIIRLASYLELEVIAIGIENEMQAYLLHVMGCDILQGYLFSKALPANEIPALLATEDNLIRKQVS